MHARGRLGFRETPAVLNLLVLEDLAMAVYLPVLAGPALDDLRQIMWDRVGLIRTGDASSGAITR